MTGNTKAHRPDENDTLRILDANFNRATEGLRVLEDVCRFSLNRTDLSARFKDLRHELSEAMSEISMLKRIRCRDIVRDPGREIQAHDEYTRSSIAELSIANLQRAKQALRVLEETSKLVTPPDADPSMAHRFERGRYELYQIEKLMVWSIECRADWTGRVLYVLMDGGSDPDSFASRIAELVAGQVDVIQLRDKSVGDRELLRRAELLVAATRDTSTWAIINDRPDIARLADADGVHVGQDEIGVSECRQIIGPTKWIGVSTHNLQQARHAVEAGADYIGVGPVFPSATKQFSKTVGVDFIRQVANSIHIPWFAIGGINEGNLPQVLSAGATRVAVAQAVCGADRPADAARAIRTALIDYASVTAERESNESVGPGANA